MTASPTRWESLYAETRFVVATVHQFVYVQWLAYNILNKYLLNKWMGGQQRMNDSFLKVNSLPAISSVLHTDRPLASLFRGLAKNTQTCLTSHGKCGLNLSSDFCCMWYNLPRNRAPYGHAISLNLESLVIDVTVILCEYKLILWNLKTDLKTSKSCCSRYCK